jgi:S1-C subfamily serine protease
MSSNVLKKAADLYFNNHSKVVRPYFGFTFTQLTKPASMLKDQPEGAMVLAVDRSGKVRSPAAEAGLMEKDVIVSVDGQALSEDLLLEELLQKYKPSDQVKLSLERGKETKTLTLSVKSFEK